MPDDRFFVDEPLETGKNVRVEGIELHHLKDVMRIKIGEKVELVNGKNQLAQAELLSFHKAEATLLIQNVETRDKPKNEIILAQALPRLNRLDFIIEKGTELNATAFWLFPGAESERKELSPQQKNRLIQISISSMKQCGRLDLPPLLFKPALSQWDKPSGHLYFGDPESSISYTSQTPLIFFIGPEKGFSPSETALLQNWGAQGVRLHPNVLRIDTAAIAALALS
jgi:16S rRNA (uracil1498-N3)-methyltransferase